MITIIFCYMLFFFYSVNVSQFILAKLAAKSVMPVGNSTAWNMVSSPMDKCHLTKPLEPETIPSTPSSQKLVLASMYQEQYLSIWNPLLSMK